MYKLAFQFLIIFYQHTVCTMLSNFLIDKSRSTNLFMILLFYKHKIMFIIRKSKKIQSGTFLVSLLLTPKKFSFIKAYTSNNEKEWLPCLVLIMKLFTNCLIFLPLGVKNIQKIYHVFWLQDFSIHHKKIASW